MVMLAQFIQFSRRNYNHGYFETAYSEDQCQITQYKFVIESDFSITNYTFHDVLVALQRTKNNSISSFSGLYIYDYGKMLSI